MTSNWTEFQLGELTFWTSGATPSKQNQDFWGGNVPWISASSMKQKFLEASEEMLTDEGVKNGGRLCQQDDILLLVRGSELHKRIPIGIASRPVAFNQDVKAIRSRSAKLDQEYLYYLLKGSELLLLASVEFTGIGAGKLETPFLQNLSFPFPPVEEQRLIAEFVDAIDDRIELNRKTIETLEDIAKALFKSWFVDFDPVRSKAKGRPTGMPDEISELFPNSFVDSELGEIPSEWSVGKVGNEVGALFDGPHATPKEATQGHIFLGIKNMTGTSLDITQPRYIGLDDWERWVARVLPKEGDIVFTYEAALGLFAVIPPNLICCLGRRMALIRPNARESTPYFWFHQFIAPPFQRMIDERAIHGATVNRTPLTEFPNYPVLSPTKALRSKFESIVKPLWERIHVASEEIKILTSLRDILLPKLISGELRVADAERMLEEVGI